MYLVERNVSGWVYDPISVNPDILICTLWRGMCQDGFMAYLV
jgi:hypothetical protein